MSTATIARPPAMPALAEALCWVAAFLIGAVLRAHHVQDQVVLGDEWHALRAMPQDWWHVLTHFGACDHCIPLTLLLKALHASVGIDELAIRVLPLACGIAAVVALPLAVRSFIGGRAAARFALLLAISPIGVHYSRIARPYAVSMALAFVSVSCLVRWYRAGGRGPAACACAAAILAPWFHPTVAPFVVAPFVVLLVHALREPGRPRVRRVLALGAVSALGMLLLLGPPLITDLSSLREKAIGMRPTAATWFGALSLFAGTMDAPIVLALLALAQLGFGMLWRSDRLLAVVIAVAGCAQLAVVARSGALLVDMPVVFARYTLVLMPVLLMLASVGLTALVSTLRSASQGLALLAIVVVLVARGPIPEVHARVNDWTAHPVFQFDYDLATNPIVRIVKPARVPEFYSALAALAPGAITIVEAPYAMWPDTPYALYQMLHRQHTVGGQLEALVGPDDAVLAARDRRARLATIPYVDRIDELRARGIAYVVLHLDLTRECPGLGGAPRIDLRAVSELYRRTVGAPRFADDLIEVYELRR